jgi:DNA-binding SARP family transcriptional activator/pimeloyl-ACP methyl ester carboxylesterase
MLGTAPRDSVAPLSPDVLILGPLEVRDDAAPVSLGGPRQRALLARLALEPGRTVSVDTLLEDLWGEHQPPTAVKMIHVAVSQLRKVLPAGALQTRAPGYVLHGTTDLQRFEELRAAGRLDDALALWRGPALAEFSAPFAVRDGARLEELRLGALEDRIDADLARGAHGSLVPELEGVVAANPLRERPRRQLMLALYRSGRQADALATFRAFRAILDDELGIEPSADLRALELSMLRQDEPTPTPARPTTRRPPDHPVSYVSSGDLSIAYQVVGDGPLDIVLVHGWVCSFQPGWERPAIARFYERLAGMGRLILFDKRGTGLSDRVAGIASLEERMDDMRAVLDAVGSERAAVLGVSEGGPMSALFAATYPARTAALVVMGSFARRMPSPDYPIDIPQLSFTPEDWGVPAARRFLEERAPTVAGDEDAIRWYGSYLVRGASPGAAAQITRMNMEIDIRHVLPTIQAPSLVLYRAEEYLREATRYMGSLMPGARMTELPGPDHLPWEGDQEDVLREIEAHLATAEAEAEPDRVLATVLHARVPDGRLPVLRGHLGRFRGTEIPAGGGALRATFDGPARAIRCAHAIVAHANALGVEASAGLHTGECEVDGDVLVGVPVQLADGVASVATAGEVLVSSTVRDLVAGSGMEFTERGTVRLPVRDAPPEWRLYGAITGRLPVA